MRSLLAAVVGVMTWQLADDSGLRALEAQVNAREFAVEQTWPAASKSAAEPALWPGLFLLDPIERC